MKYPIRRKIRKQMNHSNKCICQLCKSHNVLIEHHINGRDIPNANHPSNLSYICGSCHNQVHEGIIIMEGWFTTSGGKELLWHYNNEEGLTGTNAKPYICSLAKEIA